MGIIRINPERYKHRQEYTAVPAESLSEWDVCLAKGCQSMSCRMRQERSMFGTVHFFDVTTDGRCTHCGVIVHGNGVINGGPNVKDDYWKW